MYAKNGFPGEMGLNMFKLPLFFFISGMFFPSNLEFSTFLTKKYKKLILPFCFFFLTSICIIPFLLSKTIGLKLFCYYGVSLHNFVVCPFIEENSTNGPIWFVWCLILINILYYFISILSERIKIRHMRQWVSFVVGLTGIALAYYGKNIPGHIDTALTATFFFSLGDFFYHNTNIFDVRNIASNRQCFMSITTLFIICLLAYPVNYRTNTFHSYGYLLAYLFGLMGTMSVLFLSKKMSVGGGKCLCVSALRLCGRYSLVILCTHMQIMQVVAYLLDDRIHLYGWYGICVNTVITLLCCSIICFLCKKMIPKMIGME